MERKSSRDEDRKHIWQKQKKEKKYSQKPKIKNKAYNSFDCLGEIGRELAQYTTNS